MRAFLRSDAKYVALALALHVTMFAAVSALPPPREEATVVPADANAKAVEIDPSWVDPNPPPPEPAAEQTPPTPAAPAAPALAAERVHDTRDVPTPVAPPTPPGQPAAPEPQAAAPWSLSDALEPGRAAKDPNRATLSLEQLGVGAPQHALNGIYDAGVETLSQTSEKSLKASITRPLAERDRDLGLGPEGPVIEDLLRSVYASAMNLNGKVTYRASFDADGRLTSISVLQCDGNRTDWEAIGTKVKSKLGDKEGRHTVDGYESDIEVETALKNPSGTDPGAEVSLFGFTLKDGGGPQATKIAILPLKPTLQTVEFGDTKLQVPVVMFTVFAAAGDLSDIGSLSHRVVHARVVHKPREWKLPPGIKPNARWDLDRAERERLDRKNQNGGPADSKTPRL